MKLSVIVPIYNAEKYLDICIKSILNQSKEDIELILIDDGSTDNSGRICDEWTECDKRVKTFHQENRGTLMARKMGIEKATSDYVTFVDADDFVDIESFAHADIYMKKKIDVICFGISRYYDNEYSRNNINRYEKGIYTKEQIKKGILSNMMWDSNRGSAGLDPSLCSKIFRREVIKKASIICNDIDLDIGDDIALVYPSVWLADSMAISDVIYYNHRQRKKGEIAPYFRKNDYFDRVYNLYCLLKSIFKEEQLIRQAEHLCVSLLQEKLEKFSTEKIRFNHVFPFDRVKKNSNIVLYGAGKIGREFYYQLMKIKYCREIIWVDKDWKSMHDERILDPKTILSKEFDYIVIAIKTPNVQDEIKQELICKGISEADIVMIKPDE